MLVQSYQNATTKGPKSLCSGTMSYAFLGQGYCSASPCSLDAMSMSTNDDTNSGSSAMTMPMMPSYSATTCPNALATGLIATGYAVSSASYASTDTTCLNPTSVTYTPVGVCFQDISNDGITILGSQKLTADSSGNLFWWYYDYTTTNLCDGTSYSVTMIPQQACGLASDGSGYNKGYYHSPSTTPPSVGTGSTQLYSYFK